MGEEEEEEEEEEEYLLDPREAVLGLFLLLAKGLVLHANQDAVAASIEVGRSEISERDKVRRGSRRSKYKGKEGRGGTDLGLSDSCEPCWVDRSLRGVSYPLAVSPLL